MGDELFTDVGDIILAVDAALDQTGRHYSQQALHVVSADKGLLHFVVKAELEVGELLELGELSSL